MWWFVPGVLLIGVLCYKWLTDVLEEQRHRDITAEVEARRRWTT